VRCAPAAPASHAATEAQPAAQLGDAALTAAPIRLALRVSVDGRYYYPGQPVAPLEFLLYRAPVVVGVAPARLWRVDGTAAAAGACGCA
jgi:hypothetical protein